MTEPTRDDIRLTNAFRVVDAVGWRVGELTTVVDPIGTITVAAEWKAAWDEAFRRIEVEARDGKIDTVKVAEIFDACEPKP